MLLRTCGSTYVIKVAIQHFAYYAKRTSVRALGAVLRNILCFFRAGDDDDDDDGACFFLLFSSEWRCW